jgi:hypothetical protein
MSFLLSITRAFLNELNAFSLKTGQFGYKSQCSLQERTQVPRYLVVMYSNFAKIRSWLTAVLASASISKCKSPPISRNPLRKSCSRPCLTIRDGATVTKTMALIHSLTRGLKLTSSEQRQPVPGRLSNITSMQLETGKRISTSGTGRRLPRAAECGWTASLSVPRYESSGEHAIKDGRITSKWCTWKSMAGGVLNRIRRAWLTCLSVLGQCNSEFSRRMCFFFTALPMTTIFRPRLEVA